MITSWKTRAGCFSLLSFYVFPMYLIVCSYFWWFYWAPEVIVALLKLFHSYFFVDIRALMTITITHMLFNLISMAIVIAFLGEDLWHLSFLWSKHILWMLVWIASIRWAPTIYILNKTNLKNNVSPKKPHFPYIRWDLRGSSLHRLVNLMYSTTR